MGKQAERYNDHAKARERAWKGAQDPPRLSSVIIFLTPFRLPTACDTATIQDAFVIDYKCKEKKKGK